MEALGSDGVEGWGQGGPFILPPQNTKSSVSRAVSGSQERWNRTHSHSVCVLSLNVLRVL